MYASGWYLTERVTCQRQSGSDLRGNQQATRFDTLDPMPLVFFYSCHDCLFALVCAEVRQANFSPPRSRFRRTCWHSLSWSSAEGKESAAPISTICRKVATRRQ